MKNIFLFVLVLLAISCTEKIEMDPRERVVTVECILENSTVQTLRLNYSSYISDNTYSPITEAEIVINELDGAARPILAHKFTHSKDGVWHSNFSPREGTIYNLTICLPEGDTISATTSYVADTSRFRKRLYYAAPSLIPENLYMINNLSKAIDEIDNFTFPDYTFYNTEVIPYPWSSKKNFSEDFDFWIYGMDYDPIKNEHYQADLITTPYHDSLYARAITNHYYDFLDFFNILDIKRTDVEEFKDIENVEIPFSQVLEYGIPQYLHGLYNRTSNTMHYRYLRIRYRIDRELVEKYKGYDGARFYCDFCQHLYIAANFKPYKYGIPHPKTYLVFMLANDDYDKYLKDLITYEMRKRFKTGTILTDIYNYENPVYSNIKNGIGIFGGKYIRNMPYTEYESITYKGKEYVKKFSID